MKICPNCQNQINDETTFCPMCGSQVSGAAQPAAPVYQQPPQYAPPVAAYDPADHTAEFDMKDISDNKVIAMLVYLLGWVGIIIALLAANSSKYVSFHLRQALKITVVETLLPIAMAVAAIINIIPFLGWIVYGLLALAVGVSYIITFVLKIICFFQICKGKAKEPAIISKLGFLK